MRTSPPRSNPSSPVPWLSCLVLGLVLSLAVGCASTGKPEPGAEASDTGEVEIGVGSEAAAPAPPPKPARPKPRARTFKLGFWIFDLLAFDLDGRGGTLRFFDIRDVFKLMAVGGGSNYHMVDLAEAHNLFNIFETSHLNQAHVFRLADLEALRIAGVRVDRESERKSEAHFLKVPILGSFFRHERDGGEESWGLLYLLGYDVER